MNGPRLWAAAAGLGMVWWLAIRMLWMEWEVDPQYGYGFLVPILCGVLVVQRWRDRPERTVPGALGLAGALAVPAVGYLLLVPPFFEANPEWRPLGMAGAFAATLATLLAVYGVGGRAWLRHFLFPVAFFLISIPWPRNLEGAVMGYLMEQNAIAALEVLHWCGVMAVRSGHLISLPTGMIGVEEACSGVRSLQSGIMTALFLGEMFRFGWFSRVALVGGAVGISLVGNFLRATGLSLLASEQGIAAIEKWHDTAGLLILGSTLGGIWLLALWWRRRGGGGEEGSALPSRAGALVLPASFAVLGGLVFLSGVLSLVGTEVWYRVRGAGGEGVVAWGIQPGTPGTQPVPVPDRTRRILFFPEGFSEKFVDAAGLRWQVFYFRWPPGRTAVQAVGIHDPRTCLASIGMELESQLPPLTLVVEGVAFPFRVFLFRAKGRPVLVFHAILSDSSSGEVGNAPDGINHAMEDYSMAGRFKMMTRGIRNSGQTLFEAAVWGTTDVAAASKSLEAFLSQALVTAGREGDR